MQVEESHQDLTSQLQELDEGLRSTLNQIPSSATDYLHNDDYYLQTLAAVSALDLGDGKELRAKVAELTEKLSELNREEIECRLNRIYLEQLAEKGIERKHEQGELDEQKLELELEQCLKSLHVEIPDVAAMSNFQEFQAPLLRALAEQKHVKTDQVRTVLEDVCDQPRCYGRTTDKNR